MPTPVWQAKAEYLQSLMLGINSRHGTVNCGRVALRLDDYLREGQNQGLLLQKLLMHRAKLN